MHSLQVSKMAIGLQIIEPWLREYQVSTSVTGIILTLSFDWVFASKTSTALE
jgi:tRNA (adenine-N(1)-)-methyltransferase non-catalytic subunit